MCIVLYYCHRVLTQLQIIYLYLSNHYEPKGLDAMNTYEGVEIKLHSVLNFSIK